VLTRAPAQVVIAERGGKVYYLEISRGKLTQRGVARLEHEVACLDITPFEGHKTAEVLLTPVLLSSRPPVASDPAVCWC
jgi:hypothetical protein